MGYISFGYEGNEVHYSEAEFKRDFYRYFDDEIDTERKAYPFHQLGCTNWPCENCIFNKYEENAQLSGLCQHKMFYSFENIKKIYAWAQEHPFKANNEVISETMGVDLSLMTNDEIREWLDQEYKEPNKEDGK